MVRELAHIFLVFLMVSCVFVFLFCIVCGFCCSFMFLSVSCHVFVLFVVFVIVSYVVCNVCVLFAVFVVFRVCCNCCVFICVNVLYIYICVCSEPNENIG